jgi:hypothetical protein
MEKVQKNDYKKKKNCFEIQTPDRNYHLFASTGEVCVPSSLPLRATRTRTARYQRTTRTAQS